MAIIRKFIKKPWEEYEIFVKHANRLPYGVILESVDVDAFDADGNDITSTIIGSTPRILDDNTTAGVFVKGGTDGLRVTIKFRVICNDNPVTKIETNVVMQVQNG